LLPPNLSHAPHGPDPPQPIAIRATIRYIIPVMDDTRRIQIPPHIQGLVFDCDGTIADTMPLHYQAWVAALGEHGVDFPEALFYDLAGVPTARIIEMLNERHGYHMPVQETADRKDALFYELIPKVIPIDPVVKIVKQYRGKLPMVVATGGTRVLVTRTLSALSLLDCFQAIVTADDVLHGKPAPDIFLESARRIGVDPTLCCAFEDGELGLQSARAAGMLAIDIRPFR
jgi:HAD superfamily hydrolase (TIGR01509 family)